MFVFYISGLILEVDVPGWALHEKLKDFLYKYEYKRPDVRCTVIFGENPKPDENEAVLVAESPSTIIYEVNGAVYRKSGGEHDIPFYMIYSESWSNCRMYVNPQYHCPDYSEIVKDGIFSALRDVVIAALAYKNGLFIHSCSIIWREKAILFSAVSGTGKTTHANLWKQKYGVQVLDGDVTALRFTDRKTTAYGLPWCGTSGEFLNRSLPLGAIVFLQRANENSIEKLSKAEAFIRLTARCFMLRWSSELTALSLDTAQKIAENADCYVLNCLPDFEAVELVKNCLGKK